MKEIKPSMNGLWCQYYMEKKEFQNIIKTVVKPFFPEAVSNLLAEKLTGEIPYLQEISFMSMRSDTTKEALSWVKKTPSSAYKKRIIKIIYDEIDETVENKQ